MVKTHVLWEKQLNIANDQWLTNIARCRGCVVWFYSFGVLLRLLASLTCKHECHGLLTTNGTSKWQWFLVVDKPWNIQCGSSVVCLIVVDEPLKKDADLLVVDGPELVSSWRRIDQDYQTWFFRIFCASNTNHGIMLGGKDDFFRRPTILEHLCQLVACHHWTKPLD